MIAGHMLRYLDLGSQKVIIHTWEAHFGGVYAQNISQVENVGGQKSGSKIRVKESQCVASLRGQGGSPAISCPVIDMA